MKINIVSKHGSLNNRIAQILEDNGIDNVSKMYGRTSQFVLRYGDGIGREAIDGVRKLLKPFVFPVLHEPRLEGDSMELELGAEGPLDRWKIRVCSDDADFAKTLADKLMAFGFAVCDVELSYISFDEIRAMKVPAFIRQCMAWCLSEWSPSIQQVEEWGTQRSDAIDVFVRNPKTRDLPLKARLPIRIETDDLVAGNDIRELLLQSGFGKISVSMITEEHEIYECIRISSASWQYFMQDEMFIIRNLLQSVCEKKGVNVAKYPIEIDCFCLPDFPYRLEVSIILPIHRCLEGSIGPYGLGTIRSYSVQIFTDDALACAPLAKAFKDSGFASVWFHDLDRDPPIPDIRFGYHWESPNLNQAFVDQVRNIIHDFVASLDPFSPIIYKFFHHRAIELVFDISVFINLKTQ